MRTNHTTFKRLRKGHYRSLQKDGKLKPVKARRDPLTTLRRKSRHRTMREELVAGWWQDLLRRWAQASSDMTRARLRERGFVRSILSFTPVDESK